jgi:tRNA (guanine37-N1)-methyltransferase
MRISIVTLFPEMFVGPLDVSIVKRARERNLVDISIINIRDFAADKHKVTDDYPYGGGGGMVMKPEPLAAAIEAAWQGSERSRCETIYLSPQGERFTQELAMELAQHDHLVIVCGHYEGIDERIREKFIDRELSVGDYVLSGGELPAMVVVDSLVRLLPGALHNEASWKNDSFSMGFLDWPHYTRPEEFRGMRVPDVLLSGNHQKIAEWRRQKALERTWRHRPDLLEKACLSEQDRKWLAELRRD